MKWFKHDANQRNELTMKLIRSKFGAEGYGIYNALKEVVAEYVEDDNLDDWGSVDPLHTIETLAEECCTTAETMKDFLVFCNEKNIFQKVNGKLFDPHISKQLDNFFDRVKSKNEHTTKSVRSKNKPTTDIEENRIDKNRKEENRLESTQKYLLELPDSDLEDFTSKFICTPKQVKAKGENLYNYCKSKGKVYKDYKAFLRNALEKDFGIRQDLNVFKPDLPGEVSEVGLERLRNMKEQLLKPSKVISKDVQGS